MTSSSPPFGSRSRPARPPPLPPAPALSRGPTARAGGALAAVSDGFWMPPHRSYITSMTSSTVIVAGAMTIAIGALETPDLVTLVLALIAASAVLGLELAHAGRRLSIAAVPSDLD